MTVRATVSRGLLCFAALGALLPSVATAEDAKLSKWKEDYAYSLGVQAYIFSYPWVYLPTLQYQWVVVPPKHPALTPNGPINHWWHARNIITADYRDGGAPNNDTLYSTAWLDVGKEPIILTHGDMGDRYFTFEIASMNSDNFAYVGASSTGSKAGSYAITGPNWKGALPDGVKPLAASPTDAVLIFGRTAVKGKADVAAANKAQDSYKLTPLNGRNKYALRFAPNQLPEVKYFWSLTMYDLTNNLVPNPIDRWAIGSLGGGFQKAADGSLTLYLQKDSPGKDKEANWLPAPEGEFWAVFRTYGPGPQIVDGSWKMPPLEITK